MSERSGSPHPNLPPQAGEGGKPHCVRIARGSFYLSQEMCALYLPGIEAIAPLSRDGQVFLLPLLSSGAGGLLLKLRNARGDRVVHALEYLRTLGIDADTPERSLPVRWISDLGGLLLVGLAADGAAPPQP